MTISTRPRSRRADRRVGVDIATSSAAGSTSSARIAPDVDSAPKTGVGRVPALVLSSLAIGAANYGMSWVAVRLMPADQFARYATAQGLLLVLGTGSLAAVPWAVARFVARTPDPRERSAGLRFGLVASAAQAAVIGPLAFLVTWRVVDLSLGLAVGTAAVFISLLAAPSGWFQGRADMRGIVVVRCLEAGVRVTVALAFLVAVSTSAIPAVASFAIGAATALGYGLWRARDAFPLLRISRDGTRDLVRQAVALGGVQILLAALGAMDTVYVATIGLPVDDEASYQAAALFARIPLFFSSALSIAVFARLAAASSDHVVRRGLTGALRSFVWLSVPTALICATVPDSVVHLLVPSEYDRTTAILRIAGLTGILVGAVNVVTTGQQARLRYKRCLALLAVGVVLQALAENLAGLTHDAMAFTVAGLAVLTVTTVAVSYDARLWLSRPTLRWTPWAVPVVVGAVVMAVFRGESVVWCAGAAVAGVACVVLAFRGDAIRSSATAPLPDESLLPPPEEKRPS